MSLSYAVPRALVPNYALTLTADTTVSDIASSVSPKVLVWSGLVAVPAAGTGTLTWTYASATSPKLFAAGDYVLAQKQVLLADSTLTAALNPAATDTTQTLVLTGDAVAGTIYVEVWRVSSS